MFLPKDIELATVRCNSNVNNHNLAWKFHIYDFKSFFCDKPLARLRNARPEEVISNCLIPFSGRVQIKETLSTALLGKLNRANRGRQFDTKIPFVFNRFLQRNRSYNFRKWLFGPSLYWVKYVVPDWHEFSRYVHVIMTRQYNSPRVRNRNDS